MADQEKVKRRSRKRRGQKEMKLGVKEEAGEEKNVLSNAVCKGAVPFDYSEGIQVKIIDQEDVGRTESQSEDGCSILERAAQLTLVNPQENLLEGTNEKLWPSSTSSERKCKGVPHRSRGQFLVGPQSLKGSEVTPPTSHSTVTQSERVLPRHRKSVIQSSDFHVILSDASESSTSDRIISMGDQNVGSCMASNPVTDDSVCDNTGSPISDAVAETSNKTRKALLSGIKDHKNSQTSKTGDSKIEAGGNTLQEGRAQSAPVEEDKSENERKIEMVSEGLEARNDVQEGKDESDLDTGTIISPLDSVQDEISPAVNKKKKDKFKWLCSVCLKTFDSHGKLVSHKKRFCSPKSSSKSRHGNFSCKWCEEKFKTAAQRNTHNRTQHIEKKSYPCKYCSRVFSESSHCKRHIRCHTGERPFSCEICGKEFVDGSYIRRHMLIHTGVKPFQCELCGKTFREKTHLSRHELTHKREHAHCLQCKKALHGDKNRCHCTTGVKVLKPDVKKNFRCQKCDKGFAKEGNYQRHLQQHDKDGNELHGSVYTCSVCQKEFGVERHLSRHMRIHTGEKPFKCKECGKQFRDSSYIRRHMRIHAGFKPFECDFCSKAFRESGHLARHVLVHTGEKKFSCSTCGKGYQDKVCLLRHEAKCIVSTVDPDEKVPELCDICGKEYLGKGSLRRHRLIHTGNKPHHCTLCPAQFYDASSLRRHSAIHSRDPSSTNECQTCRRVFRTRKALGLHVLSHQRNNVEQVSKFECKICSVEFPNRKALKLHAATHTGQVVQIDSYNLQGEAPEVENQMAIETSSINLECKLCNKLFATPQNLANHELTHTQSLLGDSLASTGITMPSSSQEVTSDLLVPPALLDPHIAANADDFEGLFKLLQVIAQANQHQAELQVGGLDVPAAITLSTGVGSSSTASVNPQIVRVMAATDTSSDLSDQLMAQPVVITTPSEQLVRGEEMDTVSETVDPGGSMDEPSMDEDECPEMDTTEVFQCEHCDFGCTDSQVFATHVAEHHPGIIFAKHTEATKDSSKEEKEQQWQCPFCNEVFTKEKEFRDHNCKGVKDKPFKCIHCDMRFPRKPALNQHMKVHEDAPKYNCSHCSRSFHFKNSLVYHERIHTQEKPFLCTTCGKGFKDKSHLTRHQKMHQGIKPYSCQICPKSFLERSQLVKHIRVHSGEKPYLCATCGKNFSDASHLRRHTSLHQKDKERKHACQECNKSFRTIDGLRSHSRTHKKVKSLPCDQCNKCFKDSTLLKRHQRCHREERPYSCQICDKQFRERCHLVKHFRVHTGAKPYPCNVCNKHFADTAQRKRHVISAHVKGQKAQASSDFCFCGVCGEVFNNRDLLIQHGQNHRGGTFVIPAPYISVEKKDIDQGFEGEVAEDSAGIVSVH
ncbi:Zinc finger protein 91 [Holothuria leucospilota]|uniref:Zinc finger protein 91 n=1 Tax=Holothuria leucospilota TaxID=206669 RepID=A0A9Q1BS81_HOLLE|nr:Zinc finger protein 91 [Holothuria leucospilota]